MSCPWEMLPLEDFGFHGLMWYFLKGERMLCALQESTGPHSEQPTGNPRGGPGRRGGSAQRGPPTAAARCGGPGSHAACQLHQRGQAGRASCQHPPGAPGVILHHNVQSALPCADWVLTSHRRCLTLITLIDAPVSMSAQICRACMARQQHSVHAVNRFEIVVLGYLQTHRTQLASGNPSGRAEWNFRCCFALELPNVYDDIKVLPWSSKHLPAWAPTCRQSECLVCSILSTARRPSQICGCEASTVGCVRQTRTSCQVFSNKSRCIFESRLLAGDNRGRHKDAGKPHLGHLDPLRHRVRDRGYHCGLLPHPPGRHPGCRQGKSYTYLYHLSLVAWSQGYLRHGCRITLPAGWAFLPLPLTRDMAVRSCWPMPWQQEKDGAQHVDWLDRS